MKDCKWLEACYLIPRIVVRQVELVEEKIWVIRQPICVPTRKIVNPVYDIPLRKHVMGEVGADEARAPSYDYIYSSANGAQIRLHSEMVHCVSDNG